MLFNHLAVSNTVIIAAVVCPIPFNTVIIYFILFY